MLKLNLKINLIIILVDTWKKFPVVNTLRKLPIFGKDLLFLLVI